MSNLYPMSFIQLLLLDIQTLRVILALIWLLVAIFLVLVTIFLFKYMIHVNSKDHIGYLPTMLSATGEKLTEVIKKYVGDQTSKYNLVEPGAGLGNVSYYLSLQFKWKQVLAIEDEIGTILVAKLKGLFRQKTVTFVKANIFEYDFPTHNVIYCYLLSEMIDKLYSQGKLRGSLVISLTFPLTDIKPTETFELAGFQKHMFLYDFRDKS